MAFDGLGTRRIGILIVLFICMGNIFAETEKDFEFAGEKASFKDDEDFLADEAGSGDIEGSADELIPPGKPTQYRVVLNITNAQYTPEIAAAGRDIARLAITQQLQRAIERLMANLPGTIRIRIVDLQPGSLMVTFDIDSDGSQSQEEIEKLLAGILKSGTLNGYAVSPEGYKFQVIRSEATCPSQVGRAPSPLPSTGNNWANLMVNNVFDCSGYVVAWNYFRATSSGTAYIGIFRQVSSTQFILVASTFIQEDSIGEHTLQVKPILVQAGDFIGVYHDKNAGTGVIARAVDEDNFLPASELYQNYYISMYSSDIVENRPFSVVDYVNFENTATYAIQADMSYANVPVVTEPPRRSCASDEWTCKNGDCISADYRCDQQPDCYDGSDEENCPVKLCRSGEVQCGGSAQCIPVDFLCNGVNDCGDNWDEEQNCVSAVPDSVIIASNQDGSSSNSFILSWSRPFNGGSAINGYMIRYRQVFVQDGRLSSEGKYILQSARSEFQSVSLSGTAENYLLGNLQPNTYYEVEIYATNDQGLSQPQQFIFKTARAPCADDQFQCDNGGCIDLARYCDNFPDCSDDSDEKANCNPVPTCSEGAIACRQADGRILCVPADVGCMVSCRDTEFQCLDGKKCISFLSLCDGRQDCDDRSDENNCDCAVGEFQCADGRQCISESLKCNNRKDCEDNSDENNCPCAPGSFQCRNTAIQECVDQSLVCDKVDDCSDGSDEENCPGGCSEGQWQCNDGTCVPDFMRCDGAPQCEDLSDEENCRVACRSDQFTCADGNCVEGRMKCDGVPQCEDGSDEVGCPVSCRSDQFICADRNCLEGSMRCDGRPQCEDASDEVGCPVVCKSDQFTCADGNCVEGSMRCDGRPQCEDASDEVGCPVVCSSDQFTCADGNCVEGSMRCDGRPQCEDASDEVGCPVVCSSDQFTCADGNCLEGSMRCDGRPQCEDASDEVGCPVVCKSDQFTCADGNCVEGSMGCDGRPQCEDASDEVGCPVVCSSDQFTCADGNCVEGSMRCDGRPQCEDASDEVGCPVICKSDQFTCADGNCLEGSMRCDGRPQCEDASDEVGCPVVCKSDQFTCADGNCVEGSMRCDGKPQCEDASDEVGCPVVCSSDQFTCADGNCVEGNMRCDGRPQCEDASDEVGCPVVCRSDQFTCADGNCVEGSMRCDGRPQCEDASDEVGCPVVCKSDQFTCADGNCLEGSMKCDGRPQYEDASDEVGCPVVCKSDQFTCADGNCLEGSMRCDGRPQCEDASDEVGCPVVCKSDQFTCADGNCLEGSMKCDGRPQCEDASDEVGCPVVCKSDQFTCADGNCLEGSMRCDGRPQCEDASDEVGCPVVCKSDQFTCADGNCVEGSMRCDGRPQCEDATDEVGCPVVCKSDQFTCADGNCLEGSMRCDGRPQCEDASDEVGCPVVCKSDQFTCADGNCVEGSMRCDGRPQCEDASDEVGCPVVCSSDQFTCADGNCVEGNMRCDGRPQCEDASDEVGCPVICRSDQFTCADGNCVEGSMRCDGRPQCEDASDEVGCPVVCKSDQFTCADGNCLEGSMRCDGRPQCEDASDEVGCPVVCKSDQFTCADGNCVEGNMRCDGSPQCEDASDEVGCPVICRSDQFICADGNCLEGSMRCDGSPQCEDASDEVGCPVVCKSDQFTCADGNCVEGSMRCDGRPQCEDASDEVGCPVVCKSDQFTCADGNCMEGSMRCDGRPQCEDASDEVGCPVVCKSDQFTCADGNCLEGSMRCDGRPQCEDASDEVGCPVVCSSDQFTCADGNCVEGNMRCDGRPQCEDASDEVGCPVICRSDKFICADGNCLEGSMRCDGSPQCEDASDEVGCPVLCSSDQFTCADGNCLEGSMRCDGRPQCEDATDEVGCPVVCKSDQFTCADGNCVEGSMRCDGRPQCEDATDEVGCPVVCKSDQFTCADGNCVEGSMRCDGRPQCEDATDEVGCQVHCRSDQFTCDDGNCVEGSMRCDGKPQCEDASDEVGCEGDMPHHDGQPQFACRSDQFTCADGNCVEGSMRCDGRPQCEDSSDEVGCPISCRSDQFTCADGNCVEASMRCDGRPQCEDSSDEVGCPVVCRSDQFTCADGNCVEASMKCDGIPQCEDSSDEVGCPVACRSDQFTCADGNCVEGRMKCDGRPQCEDGSDEVGCPVACRSDQYTCADGNCVEGRMRCDGRPQCEDGSDEVNCPVVCRSDQFTCADGNCVEGSMKCDGRPQCEDGSDEVGCPVRCRSDQFTCADGNCVEGRMRCDGRPQCEDRSDEVNCPTRCREGMFECADGNCVEGSMRCDGVPQCEDRSDESGCPTQSCPRTDFQCLTRDRLECIDRRLQCNGYPDCSDGSDEQGCPGCRRGEFRCISDGRCLPAWTRCNGRAECRDQSDERDCACTDEQFECGDGSCIDMSRRCDRRDDCADRSDELACPCRQGEFQCVNGDCIDERRRCNQQRDCRDGSDEQNCPSVNRCQSGSLPCGTGHCLPEGRWCDGYPDCPDRSDERNCSLQCAEGEMECEVDNKCIPREQLCNRVYDCSDGRDELANCPRCNSEDEFECESDKSCISLAGRCNGVKECSDGSDEMSCPTRPPISVTVSPKNLRIRAGAEAIITCMAQGLPFGARIEWIRSRDQLPMQSAVEGAKLMIPVAKPMDSGTYICRVAGLREEYSDDARLEVVAIGPNPDRNNTGNCGRDEAVCQNGQCIRREYRCDGEKDCDDGSDEPEDCYTNICEPNEFQCPTGQCVMKIWRCDGEDDCEGGYDEQDCEPKREGEDCSPDEFQCISGNMCVPLAYQCDAEIDCLDRSDEIGCSPPIITVPPVAEIEVELGSTFTIICEAMGVPTPLIVWRLNWGNIPTGPRVVVTSSEGKGQLVISDARFEDAGAYTCEAINNRGSIFAIPDALVIVRRGPDQSGIKTTRVVVIGGSPQVDLIHPVNTVIVGYDSVCPENIQVQAIGSTFYNLCPSARTEIEIDYVAEEVVDFEFARKIVLLERRGDTLPEPIRDITVLHMDGLPPELKTEDVKVIQGGARDKFEIERRVIEIQGRDRNRYRPEKQILNIGVNYPCQGSYELLTEDQKQVLVCKENVTDILIRGVSRHTVQTKVILTGNSRGHVESNIVVAGVGTPELVKPEVKQIKIESSAFTGGPIRVQEIDVTEAKVLPKAEIFVERQPIPALESPLEEVIKSSGAERVERRVFGTSEVVGPEYSDGISGQIFEITDVGHVKSRNEEKLVEIGSNFVCDTKLDIEIIGSSIVCKCGENVTNVRYIGKGPTNLEILRETFIVEGKSPWSNFQDQDFILIYMGGVPEYLKKDKETVVVVTGFTADRKVTNDEEEIVHIIGHSPPQNRNQRQTVLVGLSRNCEHDLVSTPAHHQHHHHHHNDDDDGTQFGSSTIIECVDSDRMYIADDDTKTLDEKDVIEVNVDTRINRDGIVSSRQHPIIPEHTQNGNPHPVLPVNVEKLFVIKGATDIVIDRDRIMTLQKPCIGVDMDVTIEGNMIEMNCKNQRKLFDIEYLGENAVDLFLNKRVVDINETPLLHRQRDLETFETIIYLGSEIGAHFHYMRGVEYFRNIRAEMEQSVRKVLSFKGLQEHDVKDKITYIEIGYSAKCDGYLERYAEDAYTVIACRYVGNKAIDNSKTDHLLKQTNMNITKEIELHPIKPTITEVKIIGHSPEIKVKEKQVNISVHVTKEEPMLPGNKPHIYPSKDIKELDRSSKEVRNETVDVVLIGKATENTADNTNEAIDEIDKVGVTSKTVDVILIGKANKDEGTTSSKTDDSTVTVEIASTVDTEYEMTQEAADINKDQDIVKQDRIDLFGIMETTDDKTSPKVRPEQALEEKWSNIPLIDRLFLVGHAEYVTINETQQSIDVGLKENCKHGYEIKTDMRKFNVQCKTGKSRLEIEYIGGADTNVEINTFVRTEKIVLSSNRHDKVHIQLGGFQIDPESHKYHLEVFTAESNNTHKEQDAITSTFPLITESITNEELVRVIEIGIAKSCTNGNIAKYADKKGEIIYCQRRADIIPGETEDTTINNTDTNKQTYSDVSIVKDKLVEEKEGVFVDSSVGTGNMEDNTLSFKSDNEHQTEHSVLTDRIQQVTPSRSPPRRGDTPIDQSIYGTDNEYAVNKNKNSFEPVLPSAENNQNERNQVEMTLEVEAGHANVPDKVNGLYDENVKTSPNSLLTIIQPIPYTTSNPLIEGNYNNVDNGAKFIDHHGLDPSASRPTSETDSLSVSIVGQDTEGSNSFGNEDIPIYRTDVTGAYETDSERTESDVMTVNVSKIQSASIPRRGDVEIDYTAVQDSNSDVRTGPADVSKELDPTTESGRSETVQNQRVTLSVNNHKNNFNNNHKDHFNGRVRKVDIELNKTVEIDIGNSCKGKIETVAFDGTVKIKCKVGGETLELNLIGLDAVENKESKTFYMLNDYPSQTQADADQDTNRNRYVTDFIGERKTMVPLSGTALGKFKTVHEVYFASRMQYLKEKGEQKDIEIVYLDNPVKSHNNHYTFKNENPDSLILIKSKRGDMHPDSEAFYETYKNSYKHINDHGIVHSDLNDKELGSSTSNFGRHKRWAVEPHRITLGEDEMSIKVIHGMDKDKYGSEAKLSEKDTAHINGIYNDLTIGGFHRLMRAKDKTSGSNRKNHNSYRQHRRLSLKGRGYKRIQSLSGKSKIVKHNDARKGRKNSYERRRRRKLMKNSLHIGSNNNVLDNYKDTDGSHKQYKDRQQYNGNTRRHKIHSVSSESSHSTRHTHRGSTRSLNTIRHKADRRERGKYDTTVTSRRSKLFGSLNDKESEVRIDIGGAGSLEISDTRASRGGIHVAERNRDGEAHKKQDSKDTLIIGFGSSTHKKGGVHFGTSVIKRTGQKGPCSPPFYNLGAIAQEDCVRCYCFGQSVQCFSSDLHVSRIALSNAPTFVRRDNEEISPVDQTYVNFKANTREYQVLDMTRALPQGKYYWNLPREFLGDRLTSYGGELKYTIFYDIIGRRPNTMDGADVIISGNGITLFYKGITIPSAGVPTSISVPLIETAWERSEGTRRGDTPVSPYADREDIMMVLQNVDYILIRGSYDRGQTTSRIGGLFMTTAVNYETDYGLAYLVEDCVCPTGYTGRSCQDCADGFTRIETGGNLGKCVSCNCNGHSNDCDPITGQCLNCQHNTEGPQCQLCQSGYYGDARGGTPNDCRACPCPLTVPSNQFSRTCYLDTDGDVTCGNCPQGYLGRRCERCAEGYNGNPMSIGSKCEKNVVEDYCDPRGSTSSQPNPFTRRCQCKDNVQGNLCDSCKPNTFHLSSGYELGCIRCFCSGVSQTCQSTSWNRAQVGATFTQDDEDFSITDMNGKAVNNQRFTVDSNNRELVYRLNSGNNDPLYWSLPGRFLGDKVTAYGGALRFTVRFSSRQGASYDASEPIIKLAGNDITLVYRSPQSLQANRPNVISVIMYEQNWIRLDGQPATREHLLMALADLKSVQIRATYEESQGDAGLRDVTMDIAEDRTTRQDRAYAVEQCVCPVGYRGLSCEDCDTGYTRSGGGLYLGLCEPCQCNGNSNECDPETGVCRNCQHNTEGDLCERCAVGYYGDASRGNRNACQKCPCPLTEAPNQFSPSCILDRDGQVTCTACPTGHTGRKCETCIQGYTGNPLKIGDFCRLEEGPDCDCDTRGTVPNTQCDEESGQCQCKPYVQGLRCARCREGHFYLEANNPQGCLTCFCSGITNQCTSSSYYREAIRPQIGSDGRHNFVLMNRRMSNLIEDGFVVDSNRNQVTFNRFEGVQRERESLFFQLPAKFRGDQVASYGGYLRFTLEYSAAPGGRSYRDVDMEIISQGQSLRLYHLFEPPLEEGKTQTYEILLRESSFSYLNTVPKRERFMSILSNIEGFLIRATYNQQMSSVTLRDVSMDTAVPSATNLGGAPMVEDCRCPEGYTGLSCQRCAQGYLRVSDGRGGLGRCVRCNCNNHASACDPDSGRCLECQHNTEGDRCERCAAGFYGDATSGTPNDCRPCPCPLTVPSNQFSRTCSLAEDGLVTCDRCPTGYTGRNCERCESGYTGNPRDVGDSCVREIDYPRPNVTVSPVRIEEPIGSVVVFKCSVSAQGTTNVVWSRLDSRRLPDRAYTSPTYDLRLTDLKREDSGRYVCTATNAYGVSRGIVELTVTVGERPIQIQIDTPRVEIDIGRTVRFTCTALSNSRERTYILSWSKQDGQMPSKAIDQNGVLLIPNVQERDEGNYVCTGSDMFNMDTAIATLIVNSGPEPAPTVRIEPRYQTVDEGTRVRFECLVTGEQPITIKWRRGGGRPLNPEATVTSDGVLTIPRASDSDESDYYCEASNDAGTTEVRTILYVTKVEKPEITIIVRKSAIFAEVGDTARLECYAEDGSGRITLFWSRSNGLPPGSTQENGILTIPNVQPSYGGNYVCTGTDRDTGRISTAITTLEVTVEPSNEPPTATVEPEKITIPMGTTGTLRCVVTGKPEPKVTWMKSRQELSANHQVNGNVLRITNAMMADRGIYVCRAENVAGSDQDWSIVEVERRMRPKIDIYPNVTQTISVGGSALFQCRVMDGDPPPTITWTRANGAPLSSDKVDTMDNGVIMFKQVTQAEQGGYKCTATNDMGSISTTATLYVTGPPTITIQPDKVVYALVGQKVSLECTADGDPTPYVYWIQPSQPRRGDVLPEGGFSDAQRERGTAILDIASVDRSDAGYYTCVASNTGGRTEDNVQLLIRETDNVGVSISGPSTVSAVEGQDIELVCSANALRNPVLRWSRREGALPPGHSQRNGVLNLPRFRSEYSGEYICNTRTAQASYEASVFIIVTVAPKLTVSPQSITARAGETVQLRCSATGSGPFNIEWSKVEGQMNPRATERNGVLEIRGVTAADAGRYRCAVENDIGSNVGYARISVEVPPSINMAQRDVQTQIGRNVEMRCDASGSPPPVVRWQKENDELPVQHRVQNGVLTIYNVQPEDQGRYICTATSSSGTSRDYGVLTIIDDGAIGTPDGNVNTQIVNVGDRVSMECIITGTPLPTITWSRDDGPLPRDVIIGDSILIIPQAKIEDAGTYTCKAVNIAGSITSKVVLYVRAQPEVTAPTSTTAALGDQVSLICDANGYPSPEITWFRKDGEMPPDYTIIDGDLLISRVRPEDAGTYVCHATNEYGTTDTSVSLTVGSLVPYFSQNPQSYMAFEPLQDVYLDFDLQMSLRPESTEGLVLYNGQFEDGGGDFLCFGLNEGYPEFRFDVGSGPAVIRGSEKLDLNKWHTIQLTRNRKKGTMIVNEEQPYTGQSPGYFTGLDLQRNMYLGGVPDYNNIPSEANFREGFVGSISEMKVKDISLDLGADALEIVGVEPYNACVNRPCRNGGSCAPANVKLGFKCMCPQGFTGRYCEEVGQGCYPGACGASGRCFNIEGEVGFRCVCPFGKAGMGCQADVLVINPFFNRTSFISYAPIDDALFSLNLNVEFKPRSLSDGIILYEGSNISSDFMALVMKDGYIQFRFDTGSGLTVIRSANPVRANEWVRVQVNRKNRDATLKVNDDPEVQAVGWPASGTAGGSTVGLNLQLPLYLGGPDPVRGVSSNVGVQQGFIGCIAELQVNDRYIDLQNDALEFYNVVDCGERRLCERQPCKNDAVCEDLPGPDYRCLCAQPFTGKNCEVEINICLTNSPCQNGAPCSMTSDGYRCDCPLGYAGDNCEKEIELNTRMSFQGDSFIELSKDMLPHTNTQERQTLSLKITTTQPDGIILWQGEPGGRPLRGSDFFVIGLKGGYVEYSYEMGSGPAMLMSNKRVDDGMPHTISVERLGRSGTLTVDSEASISGDSQGFLQMLNADGNIFIGGVSLPEPMTDSKYSDNFVGCIENIVIHGKGPLQPENAIQGYNVETCSP